MLAIQAAPMYRLISAVVIGVVVLSGGRATGGKSGPRFPVGKWRIEFSNLVVENCNVGSTGQAFVSEPRRSAFGTAEMRSETVVIKFVDDRLERWTPVGSRYVVEHWCPASQLPTSTPVLGIAEQIK
jgi:hypothetical protein